MNGSDKDAMPTNELHLSLRRKAARLPLDPDRAAQLLRMPTRRAARPLPKIGKKVLRLVRPMLTGSGASLAELSMRWEELAGQRLARICKPEKLSRSRDGTILTIVARGGPGAALVELESETLIARINSAFGRGFVRNLRIRQGRISAAKRPANTPAISNNPSPSQLQALEEKIARIPAGALRDSARKLGLALLARAKS